MAIITAFKCDRCGEREDVPEHIDKSGHGWYRLPYSAPAHQGADLCPKCWESFERWFAGAALDRRDREQAILTRP